MALVIFAALLAALAVAVAGLRMRTRYRRRWRQRRFVRVEARRGIADLERMLAECAQMPRRPPHTRPHHHRGEPR